MFVFFFFKQKTAYEMRISDWSSDVCSSDLTSVVEPQPTRDHTERMLRHFGAELRIAEEADGARRITLIGQPELQAADIVVPGDISSAAFPLVAALPAAGTRLTLPNGALHPGPLGLLATVAENGAPTAPTPT